MTPEMRAYHRPSMRRRMLLVHTRRMWPFFVWLAICFLAFGLYYHSPHPSSVSFVRGLVESEGSSLACVETARIQKIHVKEGQYVRRGELLVEMDTSLIAHGVTSDLLDAIRIETAFGDTHQDVLQAVSQRLDAMAAIEADIAECNQEWARERGQLSALQAEQQQRESLHRDRIIDRLTLDELLPDIAAVEGALALYPTRMEMYQKQLAEARLYYANMMNWLGAREGEPISDAIRRRLNEEHVYTVIDQAKAEAELHKKAYLIFAPRDGAVSQIFQREGEVVAADLPILRVVSTQPSRIRAYLEENQVANIWIGQRFHVQSMHRSAAMPATATVESISPEVSASTFMLSVTGRPVPLRAQVVTLRMDGPHEFLGGEAVYMRLPSAGILGVLDRWFGARDGSDEAPGEA